MVRNKRKIRKSKQTQDMTVQDMTVKSIYTVSRYGLWNCEHKTIILNKQCGSISGGCKEALDIKLYIYFSDYRLRASVMDTYGQVRDNNCARMIYIPIDDGCIPPNLEVFEKLVQIASEYIKQGKNIHINCISGQGRTGMFIACLLGRYFKEFIPKDKHVITWLREIYCKNAVETIGQMRYVSDFTNSPLAKGLKFMEEKETEKEQIAWFYYWCSDCDKSGYTEIEIKRCPKCGKDTVENYSIDFFDKYTVD